MRTTERRLSALEANAPDPDDERNWPWFEAVWEKGEPYPTVPPRHNAMIWQVVDPGDPPEWANVTGREAVA